MDYLIIESKNYSECEVVKSKKKTKSETPIDHQTKCHSMSISLILVASYRFAIFNFQSLHENTIHNNRIPMTHFLRSYFRSHILLFSTFACRTLCRRILELAAIGADAQVWYRCLLHGERKNIEHMFNGRFNGWASFEIFRWKPLENTITLSNSTFRVHEQQKRENAKCFWLVLHRTTAARMCASFSQFLWAKSIGNQQHT